MWLRGYREYLGWVIFLLCIMLAACSTREGVSPKEHDVYLSPGKSNDFVLSVDLTNPPPSKEALNILFLFDVSGSMKNIIEVVKSNASDILHTIKYSFPNTTFSVMSFNEYYEIHQNLTTDTDKVLQALNSVSLINGKNEIYNQVLDRARFLNWRQNARKYIILFADATDAPLDIPATGGDFRHITAQLKSADISVIVIYAEGWFKIFYNNTVQDFQFLADETKGLNIPVRSAEQVPGAIKAGLREIYLSKPKVAVPAGFAAWVHASAPRKRAESNREFDIDVKLTPPPNALDGVYQFPIKIMHDDINSGEIGHSWITIRIGLLNYNWRGPLLIGWGILWSALLIIQNRRHLNGAIRFYHNTPFFILPLMRRLLAMIIIFGIYLIFKFAPGILPEPPVPVFN